MMTFNYSFRASMMFLQILNSWSELFSIFFMISIVSFNESQSVKYMNIQTFQIKFSMVGFGEFMKANNDTKIMDILSKHQYQAW